ncbi:hypothetical protein A8F94_05905 [Bacillus sp. FJAT-27225]|nr:hypothetical protein A8F94_05905 [Bacillus sp. FJAT-27225]
MLSDSLEGQNGDTVHEKISHGNRNEQEQASLNRFHRIEQAPRFPVRRAGFWMRFWAYLLDLIVVGSIGRILLSPLFNLIGIPSSGGIFSAENIASAALFYLYFVLMTKYLGQTLGKMALGIAVIELKDGKLSWQDVLVREWIGRFISKTIFVLYLIPAFHPQKQALHDIFADTAVIHVER